MFDDTKKPFARNTSSCQNLKVVSREMTNLLSLNNLKSILQKLQENVIAYLNLFLLASSGDADIQDN